MVPDENGANGTTKMIRSIYINLAVKDVEESVKFYTSIGATLCPDYTSPTISCMRFSDNICIMLMSLTTFTQFTPPKRYLVDSNVAVETVFCLSAETKEEVDRTVEMAETSGGKKDVVKGSDMPGMYARSLEDLDGHVWEMMFFDLKLAQEHIESVHRAKGGKKGW